LRKDQYVYDKKLILLDRKGGLVHYSSLIGFAAHMGNQQMAVDVDGFVFWSSYFIDGRYVDFNFDRRFDSYVA